MNKNVFYKKFFPTFTIFSLLFCFVNLSAVFGATFKNTSELNISENENYNDNLYVLTLESKIAGNFEKDLFILSGESQFNGNAKEDLFIVGGKNIIEGKIDGDLRVIGGEIIIKGEITNDLLVIGGKVIIDQSAKINGKSLFVGAEVILNSETNQPVKIISAKSTLNNSVNSEIEVTTQNLIFASNAKINNGISYYAPKKAIEENGSIINGQINFNQISPVQDINFIKKTIINIVSFWLILKFITTLLLAFILAYVFRIFTKNLIKISIESFWKNLLFGILTIILFPIVIALLLISLIGLPFGFLLAMLFVALMIIIPAISGIMVGVLIRKLFNQDENVNLIDFQSVAIGVIVLTFVGFVPFVGELTKTIFSVVAFGALFKMFYQKFLIIKHK